MHDAAFMSMTLAIIWPLRAVSQNKELKSNLTELQDAFVQMSQQNMELASALETERHTVGELQRLLGEVEGSRDRHVEGERGEPPLLARDGKESVESEQLQATAADSKESAESEQLQVPVTATDKESEQLQVCCVGWSALAVITSTLCTLWMHCRQWCWSATLSWASYASCSSPTQSWCVNTRECCKGGGRHQKAWRERRKQQVMRSYQ